jgi:hypothetical protein
MDADYSRDLDRDGAPTKAFEPSLFVWATVMSRPAEDRAIVDAGLKALAFDSGPPTVWDEPAATYERASDEHGRLAVYNRLGLGDKIRLIPGHCDLTGPIEISCDKISSRGPSLPQALQAGGLPSPHQPLARRDDLLSEGRGSDPAPSSIAKIGATPGGPGMDTEKTNGEPTSPAITSFSPNRSRTSSVRK